MLGFLTRMVMLEEARRRGEVTCNFWWAHSSWQGEDPSKNEAEET